MQTLRQSDELMKQVNAPRFGLGLDAGDAATALGGRVRSGANGTEFPPGRGYVVKSGRVSLIQVALPQNDANIEASLDAWVDEIQAKWPERAVWYKDTLPPPEPEPEPAPETTAVPAK
jgi:hypothetical protein